MDTTADQSPVDLVHSFQSPTNHGQQRSKQVAIWNAELVPGVTITQTLAELRGDVFCVPEVRTTVE